MILILDKNHLPLLKESGRAAVVLSCLPLNIYFYIRLALESAVSR